MCIASFRCIESPCIRRAGVGGENTILRLRASTDETKYPILQLTLPRYYLTNTVSGDVALGALLGQRSFLVLIRTEHNISNTTNPTVQAVLIH